MRDCLTPHRRPRARLEDKSVLWPEPLAKSQVTARRRCNRATVWQKVVSTRSDFVTVSVGSSKLTASEKRLPGMVKGDNRRNAGALNGEG
jgi:hypothetical protein